MPKNRSLISPELRLHLTDGIAMGPGKAALLESIPATGSISAAARALGMSYKRAWLLVDSMNAHFHGPLVEAAKGGSDRGGAVLTALGNDVLASYRRMEHKMTKGIASEVAALEALLRQR
jgi:molybdate transport system regulatory protein